MSLFYCQIHFSTQEKVFLLIKEVNIAFINMHVPDFSMACENVLGAFCFLNGL